MNKSMNVLSLIKKEGDRFIFLYDDESPTALLQVFGRFASDPELDFTWYDAGILSQKVRRLRRERQE